MGVITSVLQVSGQVTLQPSKCQPCPYLHPIFLLSLPSSFINLMSTGYVPITKVAHGQGVESSLDHCTDTYKSPIVVNAT